MSILNKLCHKSRPFLTSVVRNYIFLAARKFLCPAFCNKVILSDVFYDKCKRTMAQKSITSFFKITPKICAETNTESQEENVSKSEDNDDSSPLSNGKEKRSSKRLRSSSSSGNESASPHTSGKSTPVSAEKKKKIKRQRIESSSSESELNKSLDFKEVIVKEESTDKPVKTYDSPKSKKAKIKVEETPKLKVEKSPKVKVEKSFNLKEKSPKNETQKIKQDKILTEKNGIDSSKGLAAKTESNVKKEKEDSEGVNIVPESDYNPLKNKYHPINDACWSKGEEVPYLALAKTLEAIEATSARLKMIEILSNYFRSVIALTPDDLLPSIYLCLNQLAPAYHSLELGIAETYLMKAIGQCTGRTLAQVKVAAHKAGDLGLVAEQARATQRTMFAPPPLKLRRVFAALKEIAHMTGQASVNKKIAKIQSLYIACRYSEAKYLIRSLEGKLRIGLAEQSVLQALALATATTPPQLGTEPAVLDASVGVSPDEFKKRVERHALTIKRTYCECPNYEALVPVLVAEGVAALPARCRLAPGTPLKPMLAHPTRGVTDVLLRFENEEFTCEWKYDGERAQIHVWEGDGGQQPAAAIFSRNQENNTSKYPDVIRRLPSLLKESVKSCVLDCEAVAYDTVNKKILPFQVLSTRKRKDAQESEIKVQVCVFLFDLLYLNGRPLVREPLQERRELLREHFQAVPGEWEFATSRDCSNVEEMQQFLEESVRGSCEGLMVKTLRGQRARYDIARRSHNWLKLKKDYLEGVGDSLDVVVLGAYLGRGKRAGLYGGFLLACYDPQTEEFQALCKIGTGFSDEDLQTFTDTLQRHVIDGPRNYYRYDSSHTCDVWFEASCVWEVRCADLSLSPAHRAAAGLVDPDRGISLRFPRFIRVRPDKTAEQATSAQQVAEMYRAQDQVRNQAASARHTEDDFY